MDVIVERPGALDVHNASVMACVRLPGEKGRREEQVAEFSTTTQGLLALHDWLAAHGATQVAMEATGAYWKPIWAVLEDDFECVLVNAHHVKQVPGRKTDLKDAQWLCQLLEAGLLKASLVPPKPIRTLRNLTRYRKSQIRDRQREANRLHKVMQDTGIKLDCVASDLLGKSGAGDARRARLGYHRPRGAGRPRARAAAQEAPRAQGSARGSLQSRAVSVRVSRLGLLPGWRRCSLLVTRFPHDPVGGCLSSDVSGRRDRCRPGARLLA